LQIDNLRGVFNLLDFASLPANTERISFAKSQSSMKRLIPASILFFALAAYAMMHLNVNPSTHIVDTPASPKRISIFDFPKQPPPVPLSAGERVIRDDEARMLALGFKDFLTDWKVSKLTDRNDPATDRGISYARKIKAFDQTQLEIFSLQILESIDSSAKGNFDELALYINAVAMCQPKAAILLLKHPPIDFKNYEKYNTFAKLRYAHSGALTILATRAPETALEWVIKNKNEFTTFIPEATRSSMAINAGRSNPEYGIRIAYEWFGGVPSGPLMLIAEAATNQKQRAAILSAARECSQRLYPGEPDNHRMDDIMQAVAKGVIQEGYDSASLWIEDAKPSPMELDAFASGVLWAKPEDCHRWIEWLATHDISANSAESGIFHLVSQWSMHDQRAAEEWLNSQPEGKQKYWAISAFTWSTVERSPQNAARWVMKMPAGSMRTDAAQCVYRKWPKSDPKGASTFAEKLNISQRSSK
jgi:hypothetical protein